jgi:PAS domain S-box-containing protein
MLLPAILTISIVLQITAAVLAVRLIRLSGRRWAWVLIATAVTLMAARRGISLADILIHGNTAAYSLIVETIALLTSGAIAAGIAWIGPIFSRFREAEQALRESEEKWRSIVRRALDGIVIGQPGTGRIYEANDSACRMSGYSHDELCQMTITDLLDPAETARMPVCWDRLLVPGGLLTERLLKRKDGSLAPVEIAVTRMSDDRFQAVARDIRERKEAEKALRESEQRFRLLVSSMDDVVFTLDRDQRHTGVYGSWVSRFGMAPADFLGRTAREILGDEAAKVHQEANIRALTGENVVYEWSLQTESGLRWFQTSLSPITDLAGMVTGVVGVGRDITGLMRAEEALRQSETRYRELFEGSPLAQWEEDWSEARAYFDDLRQQGVTDFRAYFMEHPEALRRCLELVRVLDVNSAAVALYGVESKTDLFTMLPEFITPQSRPVFIEELAALAGGETYFRAESVHINEDGMKRHTEMHLRVPSGHEETLDRVLITTLNTSDRYTAEEARWQSEARLHALFESAQDVIFIKDAGRRYVMVNPALCDLLGVSEEGLIGRRAEDFLPEADAAHIAANEQRILNGEHVESTAPVTIQGEQRIFHTIGVPLRDESGEIVGICSFARDVTEREQAREALRKSEEKFARAFHTSPDAIAINHLSDGLYLDINEGFTALTGYTPEDVQGKTSAEIAIWHDMADRARLVAGLREQGIVHQLEAVFRRKDGSLGAGLMAASVIEIEGVMCILSITRDISSLKEAREALGRHAHHLGILREIDRGLLAAHSPDEIAQAVLSRIPDLLPCVRTSLSTLDFEGGVMEILAVQADTTLPGPVPGRYPLSMMSEQTLAMMQQGKPIVWPNRDSLPQSMLKDSFIAQRVESMLTVPIPYQNSLFGMLNIASDRPDAYGPEDVDNAVDLANQLGVAIRQAQLNDEVRRSAAQLEALRQVGLQLAGELDLDALLTIISDRSMELLNAKTGGIYLYRPELDVIERAANSGAAPIPLGRQLRRGEGLSGRVWETGEILIQEDYANWPNALPELKGVATYPVVAVPIMRGSEFLGVLNIGGRPGQIFNKRGLAILSMFADQAAIAIRNAQLHRLAQERATRLDLAAQISREATAILDIDALLFRAAHLIRDAFGYASINIYLVDGPDLVLHGSTIESLQEMRDRLRLKIGVEGVTGHVAASGEPLNVPDVSQNPWFFTCVEAQEPIRSELAVPIKLRGEVIGVLDAESFRLNGFDENDLSTLQTLADHLAIAASNARLYAEMEAHSEVLEQAVRARTGELEAAMAHLEALTDLKDEFVANVSHELRTPITSLKLHLRLLSANPSKSARYMETLNRETQRLEHIIESLLYLSRLDQQRVAYSPRDVDINHLVEQYIIDRATVAESLNLQMTFSPCENAAPVHADPEMLGQSFSILLTNALSYTPGGGRVEVRTLCDEQHGRRWCGIQVLDTGPGIPPEERKRLFERFFRGSAALHSGIHGTGLGLAIAREILTQHGGRIEVGETGLDGRGSSFTLWLPLAGS